MFPLKRGTTAQGFAQEAVSEHAGNAGIIGVKAPSNSPLGKIRQMLGIVAPPGAVVVPEVMERIGRGSDRENRSVDGGCAHGRDVGGWHIRNPDIKKAPP